MVRQRYPRTIRTFTKRSEHRGWPTDNQSVYSFLPSTSLYNNSTLVSAVSGIPIGWIDETHLLIANYAYQNGPGVVYSGSTIIDATGKTISTFPASSFPYIYSPSFGTGTVYDTTTNSIYFLTTGQVAWTGPTVSSPISGALTVSNVVYVSGHQVYVVGHECLPPAPAQVSTRVRFAIGGQARSTRRNRTQTLEETERSESQCAENGVLSGFRELSVVQKQRAVSLRNAVVKSP